MVPALSQNLISRETRIQLILLVFSSFWNLSHISFSQEKSVYIGLTTISAPGHSARKPATKARMGMVPTHNHFRPPVVPPRPWHGESMFSRIKNREHGSGGLSFSMQGSLLQKAAFSVSTLKTPEAYGNTVARKESAPPISTYHFAMRVGLREIKSGSLYNRYHRNDIKIKHIKPSS